jgi:hypothetical protein
MLLRCRNKIFFFISKMEFTDSRLSGILIAILSQNSHKIALFEHIRITDQSDTDPWPTSMSLFKPYTSPLTQFVRPRAVLEHDHYTTGPHVEHLDTIVQHNNWETADTVFLHNVMLYKLPFIVSFWESSDSYPVYTMTPDYILPWSSTLTSDVVLPTFEVYQPSHYRLQTTPTLLIPSPQVSPKSVPSPRSPRKTFRKVLSTSSVCPITLGPLIMNETYWTPCGHAFSSAIEEALRRDPRCPMCRSRCEYRQCTIPTIS